MSGPAGTSAGTGAEGGPPESYEQARGELQAIVAALESGDRPLEETLALWERGEVLADHCQRWLDGARQRLAEARKEARGARPPEDGSDREAGQGS
jgi:exodeoxyribonuclease VII small subunit